MNTALVMHLRNLIADHGITNVLAALAEATRPTTPGTLMTRDGRVFTFTPAQMDMIFDAADSALENPTVKMVIAMRAILDPNRDLEHTDPRFVTIRELKGWADDMLVDRSKYGR
jgi:hypothetical protein